MIVAWAASRADEVREYIAKYWAFQFEFRDASRDFRDGKLDAPFPQGAWRPGCCVT